MKFNKQTLSETSIFARSENNSQQITLKSLEGKSTRIESGKTFLKDFAENRIRNQLLLSQPHYELLELLPDLESIELSNQQCIYNPCDSVNYIYFPETTILSEGQLSEDGKTIETAMIGNEGAAGLAFLFNESEYTNALHALIEGKAYRIKKDILKDKLLRNPLLQSLYFSYLQNYIREMSKRVSCVNFHTAEERFAGWFLMIQSRSKKNKFVMSQEQIANALGTQRPTISKIACDLKMKNIIDYARAVLTIKDESELRHIACDCYK